MGALGNRGGQIEAWYVSFRTNPAAVTALEDAGWKIENVSTVEDLRSKRNMISSFWG